MRRETLRFLLSLLIVMLATLVLAPPCLASTAPAELTLDDALKLALENNKELKQAVLAMDAAKVARDDAWDAHNALLMRTYVPGQDLYVSLPTGEDSKLQAAVFQTNFNWITQQKNCEAVMDSVVLAVYQKYWGVLQASEKVRAKQLAVEQEKARLAVTEARFKVGMESLTGVIKARAQLASAEADLLTAEKELDRAYADLSDLIGLPAGSRPKLTDNVAYAALQLDDPDAEINAIADGTPAVWIAKEAVRLERQTYGMLNSYDLDKVELNKAEVSVDIAREKMRQLTRGLYYQTKALEESYAALQEQVRVAEEGLRVARISYEVGLITRADLLAAEAALAQAKQAMFDLVCSHELLKLAFYKPWTAGVLMGGTGSGGSGSSGGSQASSGHSSGQ